MQGREVPVFDTTKNTLAALAIERPLEKVSPDVYEKVMEIDIALPDHLPSIIFDCSGLSKNVHLCHR